MKQIIRLDFHLHTIDDPMDAQVRHTARELVDKAAELGFGALAITLHEKQLHWPALSEYAATKGIILFEGIEQSIEGHHVLLIHFPPEVAESICTYQQLLQAKGPENLVIAAHPFYPQKICAKERLFRERDCFDAVEFSGFYHRWWNPNLQAVRAAELLDKPVVGNSDTHTLEQFGKTYTEVEAEPEPLAIIQAIKEGRGKLCTRPLTLAELLLVGYKVVGQGFMPWVDYKKSRRYIPDASLSPQAQTKASMQRLEL